MEAKHKMQTEFEDKLLEKYPFDLPSTLIQAEMQSHLEDAKKHLNASGEPQDKMTEKLRNASQEIEKNVNRSLRMFFLSRKVADDNKIDVSQEELMPELVKEMYTPGAQIDPSANIEQVRSKVYYRVLSDKVKDHLLEQAKII